MPTLHRRAILLLTAVLMAAAAGAWWRFGRTLELPLATVVEAALPLHVRAPGRVQARVPLTLAARVTGGVTEVLADVGDDVRRGQVLVRLDAREAVARRAAVEGQRQALQGLTVSADALGERAQAELVLARSRHARDADLQRQGFLSAAAMDATRAALDAAEANVRSAQATLAARRAEGQAAVQELRAAEAVLSHAEVAAPFDALVIRRLVEPGATVVPGSPLLQLVDPASVWLVAQVDEAALARLAPGQPARIRLRSGEELAGRVQRIARQSDAATREIDVHVAFDAPPARFAIDQDAEVRIDTGHARGLAVPAAALLRDRDGLTGVLRVEGGRARFVAVTPGAADAGRVLVAGALRAGDRIVAAPAGVREGARVAER